MAAIFRFSSRNSIGHIYQKVSADFVHFFSAELPCHPKALTSTE